MASTDIAAAIARAEQVFRARPSAALQPDSPATARWLGGLAVAAGAADGARLMTDLPTALGGGGGAISPGWLVRAALATCTVSCIVLAAARAGVELGDLEAEVRSVSDARGLLGLAGDEGPVDAGPGEVELVVRIAAPGVSPQRLRALAAEAQAASPMGALFEHPTPVRLTVETPA